MNNNEALLEEYFDPHTSVDRKQEIRKLLDPDSLMLAELGEDVNNDADVMQFRKRIEEIDEAKSSHLFLKIAAAVVVLAVASLLVFRPLGTDSYTNEALFHAYYQPYDGVTNTRSESQMLNKAIYAYQAGNYQIALDLFLKEMDDQINPSAHYHLMISSCYLSLNNGAESFKWLDQISDDQTQLIRDTRDWYKALSLLQENNAIESQALLHKLVLSNSLYQEQAKALLAKMN